ncbi:hypothetical protein B0H11DRAFT_2373482 [Mycena galericulata]|nr:hypothetical protein B0H11DRAFT_2373482 [Mycena galericulata]
MGCAHFATFDGGALVEASIAALAQKNPSLLENLNTKFGIQPKRSHDAMESESSPPTEAPPLKRSKTMASTLSLQKLLQREYGDEFRPGRTIEEAKKARFEINPYIANRTPTDALAALRTQLKNFLDGTAPFDRKKKPTESSREWWWVLLNREDSDILAALAVKIFSSSPVSMPDERGMSTITWVNSDVRNKQDVPTVSNHMAIRSFSRMDSQSESIGVTFKPRSMANRVWPRTVQPGRNVSSRIRTRRRHPSSTPMQWTA